MSREYEEEVTGPTVTEFLTQILDRADYRSMIYYLNTWSFILTVIITWSEQQFLQEVGCLDSGLI